MLSVIVGILLLGAPASGARGIESGNDLLSWCDDEPGFGSGICNGFITGVTYGIQADRALSKRSMPFCTRDGVSRGQIKDVVIAFIKAHPSVRDQSAAGLIEFAMIEAFPCAAPAP